MDRISGTVTSFFPDWIEIAWPDFESARLAKLIDDFDHRILSRWQYWRSETNRRFRENAEADCFRERIEPDASDYPSSVSRRNDGCLQSVVAAAPVEDVRTAKRWIFVKPLLKVKGWSILDWANASEVAYNTADGFLNGKRSYKSTLVKLASGLGCDVNEFPE